VQEMIVIGNFTSPQKRDGKPKFDVIRRTWIWLVARAVMVVGDGRGDTSASFGEIRATPATSDERSEIGSAG